MKKTMALIACVLVMFFLVSEIAAAGVSNPPPGFKSRQPKIKDYIPAKPTKKASPGELKVVGTMKQPTLSGKLTRSRILPSPKPSRSPSPVPGAGSQRTKKKGGISAATILVILLLFVIILVFGSGGIWVMKTVKAARERDF